MIVRIDHIGIAVNSIEEAVKLYTDVFGLKVKGIEIVEERSVRTAIIPVGDSKIELLESTDSDGPIAKYIERKGEGLHHLALGVSSIEGALNLLKEKGIPLIDMEPGVGVEGSRTVFLHPKGTKVLIELVEH